MTPVTPTSGTWSWSLPHDTTAPGLARRRVRNALTDDALADDDLRDDVELVASELVTNAVVHGQPPVALTLELIDDVVRLRVTDGGGGHVRRDSDDGTGLEARLLEPGGRGLGIVAAVSRESGAEPSDQGWLAWATLSSSVSGSPAQRGLGS